jgi:AMP phosphorylase
MQLKVKKLNLSSGGPLIAVLNEDDARKLDLSALDRIKLHKKNSSVIVAIDLAKSKFIKQGYIGLFEDVLKIFKIKENKTIKISQVQKPVSLQFIKKKLKGDQLSKREINEIIKDIVENRLTEIEITYFISACYTKGLTLYESAYLTEAIVENGGTLKLNKYPILDKHSVSGIPANRTTMIVVPIIAAAGFTIPKTSTRAITSAAGTSDVVETLAPVTFTKEEIKKIVKKANACMVWGGAIEIASADDKLIKIERVLGIDPEGILLASILAKKVAVNASHVIIEIPTGKGTKIETKKHAKSLKRKFYHLGKNLGINTKIIITKGSEPIGNGIGPALEARDILRILQNRKEAPEKLKEKSIYIASLLLKIVGVRKSYKKAKKILESGSAYKKFKEIIKAQGGNPNIQPEQIKLGKFKYEIKAKTSGIIKSIDNKLLVKLAKLAGAPKDKGAGIYLNVHTKHKIKNNDLLFTIYSENKKKLEYLIKMYNPEKAIEIKEK